MTQTTRLRAWPALVLAAIAVLVPAASASAHAKATAVGGAKYEAPDVTELKCGTGDRTSCPRGQVLRLSGEGLAHTRTVTFLGRKGRRDNRTARPQERSPHRVIVAVPASARTGRLRVVTDAASATGPRLKVLPQPAPVALATPGDDGGVFPVRGTHDFGSETNHFGGGRGHQGHDIFAKCGTPVVSALSGVVTFNTFQSRAGNYVVVKSDDGRGQAYMHLLEPSPVAKGERVVAGQQIGQVGETGRASGCHLHFELWTAPGWYEGGKPIDPLPALRRWDSGG